MALSLEEKLQLLELKAESDRRKKRAKIETYFPDEGAYRRELYPRHIEFFEAGKEYRERLMLAANRIGKTESIGGFELTLHLTGRYPYWWKGRKFKNGIKAWACGDTSITVRDILQRKLLGPVGDWGTGLIPGSQLRRVVRSTGIADAVDTIYVEHASGETSMCSMKTYQQGRISFQGTEQDIIWLDEEPPGDVYTECLLRTMTNNGMLMLTFTPLLGMSEVVLSFLPGGQMPEEKSTRKVVMATWDDVPHLSREAKEELWNSIPPFQRDARSKGIPQLGAGAIYPVSENDLLTDIFPIPDHFTRGFGMDVGWNMTAALWGAYDREHDVLYLTDEYRKGQEEPSVHMYGIQARGKWMTGFIDPASRGRNQKDGTQLLSDYRTLGLKLETADNGVESGLYSVWNRMATGRLKVFRNLNGWLSEFRLYRRDERGKVVKENDHLMDCMRYLESRIQSFVKKPVEPVKELRYTSPGEGNQAWMM